MGETLYAQVARELTEGIKAGRYPVGSLLPTEFELCALFGASRHTVRTAIRELQDLGLISRRKKVGTRVEAMLPANGYRQSLSSVEDLVQFGRAYLRSVQETGEMTATSQLAQLLGCAAGSRWFRISSLRLDETPDAAPVGWTDVYIDPAYSELDAAIRSHPETLISTLVAEHHGRKIAEIRQEVEAVALSDEHAVRLEAMAGTPALRVLRHYLDDAGKVFEISMTVHPAGRFTVTQRLRRTTTHEG